MSDTVKTVDNTAKTRRDKLKNYKLTAVVLISLAIPTIIAFFIRYPVYVILKQPLSENLWFSFLYSVAAILIAMEFHVRNDANVDLYKNASSLLISAFIASIVIVITICAIVSSIFAQLHPATDISVSIDGYERVFKLEDVPLYNIMKDGHKVEYIIKYKDDSVVTDNINDIVEDGEIKYRYGNDVKLLSNDEAARDAHDLSEFRGIYSVCWEIGLSLIILWRIYIFGLIVKKKLDDSRDAGKLKELSKIKKE